RGNPGYPTLDQVKLLRKAEDIEEGDIVKLLSLSLNESTLSGFEVGDVCTVEYIYGSPMKDMRLGVKKQDGRIGFCSPDNVVKLSDKIEVGDEVILDAGDDKDNYPLNGFFNGETYEVTGMNPSHPEQKGDMISIGYNWGGNEGYPTLDQVKLVRKAEDKPEETKEFNVGDYAKVVGETYNDDIPIGAIVKIYREKDVDGDYRVDLIDGSDHDYAQADSLEHYEPSERELAFLRVGREVDEIKVGDIAEVEFSPNAHSVGTLVKVIGQSKGNGVYAKGTVLDVPIEYSYRRHHLKLVAKEEDRVDINA